MKETPKYKIISLAALSLAFSFCTEHKTPATAKSKDSCLSDFENFADTLNLDTSINLGQYFSAQHLRSLNNCDLKPYREKYEFKKAVSITILKLCNYCKIKGWGDNQVELYYVSPGMRKFLDEYVFMTTSKERSEQDMQVMSVEYIKTFILKDEKLSKDTAITKLMHQQFKPHRSTSN